MKAFLSLGVAVAAQWPVGPRSLTTDPALDCGARALALQFGQALFPAAAPGAFNAPSPARLLFDALRLGAQCNATPPAATAAVARSWPAAATTDQPEFYIDAALGSDANPGTAPLPFATVECGLRASRASPAPARLLLRDTAPFFLPATLLLTAADSGLTLSALPNEAPVLSGGAPLTGLRWSLVRNITGGGMEPPIAGISVVSDVPGLDPGGSVPGVVAFFGNTDNVTACASGCAAAQECGAYTWHDATTGPYALNCFFRVDGTYEPQGGFPGHFTGRKVPPVNAALWSAPLPQGAPPAFTNLFDASTGRRLVRARHPNGNPEEGTAGFAGGALAWAPPRAYPPPQDVAVASPVRADDPFFPQWQGGVGGTCAQFSPAEGFWCSTNPPAGDQYNVPSGMTVAPGTFPGTWANAAADGAILHAFHGLRWGDWKFHVEAADAASGNLSWSWGGFQEARGARAGDTFFLEGVADFLDAPGEWHVDVGAGTLFWVRNATDAPPTAATALIATALDSLIHAEGGMDAPLSNLTLRGLTFSHTAPTFMKPYAMPSGGDFSVRLDAAVVLRGTAGAAVEGCSFVGLGGNALLLHGWNRGAVVANSLFRFVGDSAIVSVGRTEGIDGTAQDVPAGTTVAGCLGSELGLYTKQSGFYYHALSMNASVTGSAFFNTPRAGVNINDGCERGSFFTRLLARAFFYKPHTTTHLSLFPMQQTGGATR